MASTTDVGNATGMGLQYYIIEAVISEFMELKSDHVIEEEGR